MSDDYKPGKFERFLIDWNRKIEEQRQDLLSQAYGFSTSQDANKGFWARNYLKLMMYGFLGLALLICYAYGYTWPFRIIGLMLLIMVVRAVWNAIKKAWKWLKILYEGRKLLKQLSGLKKH